MAGGALSARGLRAAVVCAAAALALAAFKAAPAQARLPWLPPPTPPAAPAPAPAGTPPPQVSKPGPKPRTIQARVSNERTRTYWAHVERPVRARREPSRRSATIKRLSAATSDGTPELVTVLRALVRPNGEGWFKVRLPMRPTGRTGWVPAPALGRLRLVRTFLRIDRRRFTATLYRRGHRVWRSRIGVGKRGTATPRGDFYVRGRLVPSTRGGIYGVFAFGTSAYSPTLTDWPGGGVVGIHGTNQPELLPGRVSHGCVRVPNGRIARLRRLMPVGTPIRIN